MFDLLRNLTTLRRQALRLLCLLPATTLFGGCGGPSAWQNAAKVTDPGQGTQLSPNHKVDVAGTVAPRLERTTRFPGMGAGKSGPAGAGLLVRMSGPGMYGAGEPVEIVAIRLRDMRILWKFTQKGTREIALDDSGVYLYSVPLSGESYITALDRSTGHLRWRSTASAQGTVMVGSGHVMWAGPGDVLCVAKVTTGKPSWRRGKPNFAGETPLLRPITIHGGLLYLHERRDTGQFLRVVRVRSGKTVLVRRLNEALGSYYIWQLDGSFEGKRLWYYDSAHFEHFPAIHALGNDLSLRWEEADVGRFVRIGEVLVCEAWDSSTGDHSSRSGLLGLHGGTGRVLWRNTGRTLESEALVGQWNGFAVSSCSTIRGRDAKTGRLAWSLPGGEVVINGKELLILRSHDTPKPELEISVYSANVQPPSSRR